ncbi:hypothetical protein NMG60_11031206 [Bertholletia excelsa]
MALRMVKSPSMASLRRLCLLVCVVLLVLSEQFAPAHCRALRAPMEGSIAEQVDGAGAEPTGMASFAVSSNNSSSASRDSVIRSLAFKLASGPSRRGPGH